jgi:hypothetical protein
MNDRKDNRSGAGCVLALGLLLILPVLYVLGLGPATWLGEHYEGTRDSIVVFYMPLSFLVESCEPIEIALDWYVDFWR